jgi:hypothetical protein
MKRLTQGDDEQRVFRGIVPASDEITSLRDGVVTVTTTNHCRRPPQARRRQRTCRSPSWCVRLELCSLESAAATPLPVAVWGCGEDT